MNRRDWLKTAGAAGVAATLPLNVSAETRPPSTSKKESSHGQAQVTSELKRLNLKHTWTTTMSSSTYRDTVHLRYTRQGITGYGEGAPIQRYGISPEQAKQAIDAAHELLASGDPCEFAKFFAQVRGKLGENQHAAMAAVDIAVLDWWGKKLNVPLYEYFGLDPQDAAITTYSIGIDKPEVVKEKVREAAEFPVLKIKVGLQSDEEMIAAVRSVTDKPIRVDANEGWTDKEEAVRKINWLESQGVQFVEQPMPAHMFDEIKYVRSKVHLPLIADEACTSAALIPKLKEAYDGINVKLDKSGGVLEAYRWIQIARALDMKVMIGCMISSSCSCTAAAHLTPLVDYADLDGPLLIANDPYSGMKVEKGKIVLPSAPGLGLKLV